MSTKLTFQVVPCGATLELEHNLIAVDTWTDTANSDKLIVGNGNVDSSDPAKLICNAGIDGNPPVVTLLGASWASQVNDTGRELVTYAKQHRTRKLGRSRIAPEINLSGSRSIQALNGHRLRIFV